MTVLNNNTKLIPSTQTHKVYKRYSTYKGKVVIVDGSSIKRITIDIERLSKDDALQDALEKIEDIKQTGSY